MTRWSSSIDLAPTILHACGLDLRPPCRESTCWTYATAETPRTAIFGESFAHDIADIHDPTKSLLNLWCIEGKWKLILFHDGQLGRYRVIHEQRPREPQLFDVLTDPHERPNVAEQHPDVVQRMTDEIQQWWPEPFE